MDAKRAQLSINKERIADLMGRGLDLGQWARLCWPRSQGVPLERMQLKNSLGYTQERDVMGFNDTA